MKYSKGRVFNIQRFSSSDGPGIRTVVFLKGCPLNCIWCHNPESKNTQAEILYQKDFCVGCGKCVDACAENGHFFVNGVHDFSRKRCVGCGACAQVCSTKALKTCGEKKSTEEIIANVMRDKMFYEESGGGLTISGGEPLMQYDFALTLLKLAKECGLNTALETCGFSYRDLSVINEYTDLWLYDIKLFSKEEHMKYTGVSNEIIFKNLELLDEVGGKIVLRCPIIPEVNLFERHFCEIAKLANKLSNVEAIHLEPYHPLGISKAQQLSGIQEYKNTEFLKKSVLKPFAENMRKQTNLPVVII